MPGNRSCHYHYPVVRGNQRQLSDNDYRLLIPASLAAKVIGTGGSKIKKINKAVKAIDERARIMIYNEQLRGGPLMEGAADRVIGIKATVEALKVAIEMLIPLIQIPHSPRVNFKPELRLMVPYQTCANICGSQGANINKIRKETDSYIQIYNVSLPHSQERMVRIQNEHEELLCDTALQVWKSIAPFKKEQPIALYEPFWFEQGEYEDTGSFIDTFYYQEGLSKKNRNKKGSRKGKNGDDIRNGGRGGREKGRGVSRGGSQQPQFRSDQHDYRGNSVYKYPQNDCIDVPYAYHDSYIGETGMYWDNEAQETFQEGLDADRYAEALAQGIAIGIKQAMSMGLVSQRNASTRDSVKGGKAGGPRRGKR